MNNPKQNRPSFSEWARRHSNMLFLLAMVGLLVFSQWPMIKGTIANAIGAPIPEGKIAWRTDYAAALQESQKTGKPVLLDFSATWCPPCQMMKRDVWSDDKVGDAVTASYIPVLIDVDKDGPTASRYGIESIPTILVVDGQGKVTKQGAFMSKGQMLDFLKQS